MQEEFILETIAVVMFLAFMTPFALRELWQRRQELDELSRLKLKKIGQKAYSIFVIENKSTAKQRTAQYMKEIYESGALNEKYDLLKGA